MLLDACSELVDAELGVLASRCPHCQGYLEVLPTTDRIDIGYLTGASTRRFDVAFFLPYAGLTFERSADPPFLQLEAADRRWEFRE